jgi:hypothetical protein
LKRVSFRLLAGLALALLANACSGGSHSGGASAVPQAKATGAAGKGQLTLKLTLPARTSASARRLPKYVSAATQGATIEIVAGSNSIMGNYTLQPGSPPCASASNGASICTLSVQLPGYGATSITVSLYDQGTNDSGVIPSTAALLSTGTITTTIAEGASNVTVPVVLSGVVEGVTAGSTGTLPTGGTAGTATFTFEATDADANIILATDGAVDASGAPLTFTLTAPPAIAGITIADLTRGSAASSSLSSVKVGDVIAVSSTSATPQVAGIPIEAASGTTPVGILTTPSTVSGATPHSIAAFSSVVEIAGVPPWASLPNVPAGSGVVVLYNESAGGEVEGLSSGGQSEFTCSSGNGVFIQHIAMGPGENLDVGNSYDFGSGTYLTLAQVSLAGTPYCAVTNFNQSAAGSGNILDVATDGLNVAAIFNPGTPFVGLSNGTSLPMLGPNSVNLFPSAFTLAMWYGQYATAGINAGAGGYSGLVYVGPQQNVATNAVSPISIAVDTAGHAYALDTSGHLFTCSLGSSIVCPTSTTIASPSTANRAIAVGPDGKVYVATPSGLVQYDPLAQTLSTIGGPALDEVQASGDGHIYALASGSIYIYP